MFFKLENIPVEQIVGSRILLKQQGPHFYGLCPFHVDHHVGSFVVTPRKGIWKCFTCGDNFGGNGIKFISLYDGIDYLQAAFKVAYENNIITYEEYVEQNSKTYSQCNTIIFNQDGEMLTPTEEIYGRSVNAVQGMDITKLKIYMFDDLELWAQVYEEGAESEAVDQAVLSAEIDLS